MPQPLTIAEQDAFIAATVQRDEPRLRLFIRNRVLDTGEAEDILQDVFYEFVQTYRMMKPVEQVTAWLYRVARNRITDLFRKQKPSSLNEPITEDEGTTLEDLIPSPDAGPDAIYARALLLEALDAALDELPEEQRDTFIAHEILGRSFKELSEESGTPVNTLLSRKRYAVLHLRERLTELQQTIAST